MITPTQRIYLYVDFTRLTQVISNLLTNAAKYTDRDGDIWLTVQQAESDLVLTVRDSGIGISAEALPRIFEMHWQAERSASSRGSGLGLTLAKQFVEAHGGSIHAHSDGVGKGSGIHNPTTQCY